MAKKQPVPPYAKPDQIQIRGNQIYSILRQKWVALTPEERVRQEYLRVLIEEYGYKPEQIEEEVSVTGRGSGEPVSVHHCRGYGEDVPDHQTGSTQRDR